jgi:D-beta-D-heptose 7-phosphate kinase/D-beta-D-heptose 1-phosphate adenosyltransferase
MHISIPDFEQGRVLVVGDLMLDRYWHGYTHRISPEAPVPVVHVQGHEDRPGGAGNVALNIAALGGNAALLSLVGSDEYGGFLSQLLERAGVECYLEAVPNSATVTKLRVLSRHQQLIRLDFEDGFDNFDHRRFHERLEAMLEQADAVIFSDYGKGCLRAVEPMIESARARGQIVLVDPKGDDFQRYRGVTAITPNEAEFQAVVGPWSDEESFVAKARNLCRDIDVTALLITRGERGMTLVQRHGEIHSIPAQGREVYDVTGAGDTVIAVLAAALAVGDRLLDATALANLAAGVVVGKLGTATVTVPELHQAMLSVRPTRTGVMGLAELEVQMEMAHRRGERIVMTNGCFDLLHPGHVRYLEQARRLGDWLIVAVNGDDSVRRLKGEARPINGLEHRMTMLAALEAVDWVVAFHQDTPAQLIDRLRPDILVKGGDYRPEEIAGSESVRARGGEVVVLDYLEGYSTTDMVGRIQGQT